MYAGILLAFYAGLRRSEICGLRWNDIDFNKHTLSVRTAIGESELPGYRTYAKNPKNATSFRTFPMVLQLEKALWERYMAIKPDSNWYVIGKEDKYMTPKEFNRRFHVFAERNNLRDFYGNLLIPHGLRHNLATVGIRSGMDIASLSLMMGHASRAMTLDTYGDANADALELAAVKLRDKFNDSTQYFEVEEEAEA
jgi:integrase